MSAQSDHHLGILERSFDDGMFGQRSVEWLREYIRQLEAERWEPVPVGNTIKCECGCGRKMAIGDDSITTYFRAQQITISLDGNTCFCRRRPQQT